MRRGLSPGDLGDLLDRPLTATLATYEHSEQVRLSAVWHEWSDGGFTIVIGVDGVIARHLRRDPRAAITVHESVPPWRGIEVRTVAVFTEEDAREADGRMARRYLPPGAAERFVAADRGPQVVVRLVPGELRAWDFADDDLA